MKVHFFGDCSPAAIAVDAVRVRQRSEEDKDIHGVQQMDLHRARGRAPHPAGVPPRDVGAVNISCALPFDWIENNFLSKTNKLGISKIIARRHQFFPGGLKESMSLSCISISDCIPGYFCEPSTRRD